MINVIYLVSQLKSTGPINQAHNLMTGFDKNKVRAILVTLFAENIQSSWKYRFEEKGIELICLNSNRGFLKVAAIKLDKIIRNKGIQVVHSSGLNADTVNAMLKSSVLKVSTIRSNVDDLSESRSFLARLYSKYKFKCNLKRMDLRVGCSHALQQSIEAALRLKCECVQNGVDTDHFSPIAPFEKKSARRELGLPEDKLILLSVGVLYKRKQTMELSRAFVKANIDNAILVIVGIGEEYEELKSLTKSNQSIIIVGKKEDPCRYYQCSDLFVSASLAEGLPNAVLEAMATGLPVLLSDIGPHKEILDEGPDAGGLFVTGDANAMIKALSDIQNWNLNEKSRMAYEVIQKHFSKYITASNYTLLYEQNIK